MDRDQSINAFPIKGLVTDGNVQSLEPGTCTLARNAVFRRSGILEPDPGDNYRAEPTGGNPAPGGFLGAAAIANQVILATGVGPDTTSSHYATEALYVGGLSYTSDSFSSITQLTSLTYKNGSRDVGCLPGMSRGFAFSDRTFFNEKWSQVVDGTRRAGLPSPAGLYCTYQTAGLGFLPADWCCKYRVTYVAKKNTSTGAAYIVESAPSSPASIRNGHPTDPAHVFVRIQTPDFDFDPYTFESLTGLSLYIRIYRSPLGAATDLVTNLSEEYKLVKELRFSQAVPSVPAGMYVQVDDDTLDGSRDKGVQLYTSVEGATEENLVPPCASDATVFENCVHYVSRMDNPALSLSITGGYGSSVLVSADQQANTIGAHVYTLAGGGGITWTNGSPVVQVTLGTGVYDNLALGQLLWLEGPSQGGFIVSIASLGGGVFNVTLNTVMTGTGPTSSGTAYDALYINLHSSITAVAYVYVHLAPPDIVSSDAYGYRVVTSPFEAAAWQEGVSLLVSQAFVTFNNIEHFSLWASRGSLYAPVLPSSPAAAAAAATRVAVYSSYKNNRIWASKRQLPEAVPAASYYDVGSESCYRVLATSTCMYALCSDGVFRVTGTYGNWASVRIADNYILSSADAAVAVGDVVYAVFKQGLHAIVNDQIVNIDANVRGYISDNFISKLPSNPYNSICRLVYDKSSNELLYTLSQPFGDGNAETLRFNLETKLFSTYVPNAVTRSTNIDTTNSISLLWYSILVPSAGVQGSFLFYIYRDEQFYTTALRVEAYKEDHSLQTNYAPVVLAFNPLFGGAPTLLKQFQDIIYYFSFTEKNESDSGPLQIAQKWPYEWDVLAVQNTSVSRATKKQVAVRFWTPLHSAVQNNLCVGLYLSGSELGAYFVLYGFSIYWRKAGLIPNR